MEQREKYPPPEDCIREVLFLLPCRIYDGVFVNVLVVHILLEQISKETMPASPKGVVKHRQPICKVDLTRESIEEGEIELSEY